MRYSAGRIRWRSRYLGRSRCWGCGRCSSMWAKSGSTSSWDYIVRPATGMLTLPRSADGQSRARASLHSSRLVKTNSFASDYADSADIHDAGQLLHSSDILQAADLSLPDNVQPQA